jgi:hypothetical protein
MVTFIAGFIVLGIQIGINVVGAMPLPDVAARQRIGPGSSASGD